MQKSFIQNGTSFLMHYNHKHDKLGRFAETNGSSRLASKIDKRNEKIDNIDKELSSVRDNKKLAKYARFNAKVEKANAKAEKAMRKLAKGKALSNKEIRRLEKYEELKSKQASISEKESRIKDKRATLELEKTKLEKKNEKAEKKLAKAENDISNDVKVENPRKTMFTDEYGDRLSNEDARKLANSKVFKEVRDATRKYAVNELYKHYSEYPDFYNLPKGMTKSEFNKHVDLDQVSQPTTEGVYEGYDPNVWTTYWCDTGRPSGEYPDNTWAVSYDIKKKKIDERNSQYYR